MATDIPHDFDSAEQFWKELDAILAPPDLNPTSADIDDVLRLYLDLCIKFREKYLSSDDDLERLARRLRTSAIFMIHSAYVRMQFIYSFLQDDDPSTLYIVAAFLLFYGRSNEETFDVMLREDVFPRLVELIQGCETDPTLHRLLLVLMYEMARIVPLTWNDLASVNDNFVLSLLAVIESVSDDAGDPYHYPVIRVLLVLNEQYMNSINSFGPHAPPLTNRVLKALSTHAAVYKTFGENVILLLNRESETKLQVLILKLLFLLFGTKATAEYFYTNDLHVLLDVILRNLLDLPSDRDLPSPTSTNSKDEENPVAPMQALRHTYVRVLHPLLENSQLRRPGMAYKRDEILAVLRIVAGDSGHAADSHFAPADETTRRLVDRCRSVEWLDCQASQSESPDGSQEKSQEVPQIVVNEAKGKKKRGPPPKPPPARGSARLAKQTSGGPELAKKMLGMSLDEGGISSLSIAEVAKQNSKPGVVTPSRGLQESFDTTQGEAA